MLARWFAEAPDDEAAHRLWRAAFGLCPARHLSVIGETADAWHDLPQGTAWREVRGPEHVIEITDLAAP